MTRNHGRKPAAWLLGAIVLLCIISCDGRLGRGCTRVVSLDAQHAADEYLSQSMRIAAPARMREKYFAASLQKLRAIKLDAVVDSEGDWRVLSAAERNLAFAGLVGQKRDEADDKLLEALVAHGVEPFLLDPLGRAPFAIAVQLDHPALNRLLTRIATAKQRPADQILCGLHQWAGPAAMKTLRNYCQCRR